MGKKSNKIKELPDNAILCHSCKKLYGVGNWSTPSLCLECTEEARKMKKWDLL